MGEVGAHVEGGGANVREYKKYIKTRFGAQRCAVRLSASTLELPILKTTKLLIEARSCTRAKRTHLFTYGGYLVGAGHLYILLRHLFIVSGEPGERGEEEVCEVGAHVEGSGADVRELSVDHACRTTLTRLAHGGRLG